MESTASLREWLRDDRHVIVADDWLQACIEWVRQEINPTSRTDLRNHIYGQWLVADMREISAACLPPELSKSKSTQLNGCYAIQMDSLLDISQPAYKQYTKRRGKDDSNAEVSAEPPKMTMQPKWETKSDRLLQLQMTDGVQDLVGLEFQPVPCLNVDLPPGTKILVYGVVCCRNGTLLLTEDNMKVLGGGVDELKATHNQMAIFKRILNRTDDDGQEAPGTAAAAPPSTQETPSLQRQGALAELEDLTIRSASRIQQQQSVLRPINPVHPSIVPSLPTREPSTLFPSDDEKENWAAFENMSENHFMDSDDDDVTVVAAAATATTTSSSLRPSIEDSVDDDDDDDFPDADFFNQWHNAQSHQGGVPSAVVRPSIVTSALTSLAAAVPRPPENWSDPYDYLARLIQLLTKTKHRIKGFVMTLEGSLQKTEQGKFSLRVLVNDGSASLSVLLSNEVLENLMEMSASDFFVLKKRCPTPDILRAEREKVLNRLRKKLMELSCLMDIDFTASEEHPIVTALHEVTNETLESLQSRVRDHH